MRLVLNLTELNELIDCAKQFRTKSMAFFAKLFIVLIRLAFSVSSSSLKQSFSKSNKHSKIL